MFDNVITSVMVCYTAWQPLYETLGSEVTFHQGIPRKEVIEEWVKTDNNHKMIALDDQMENVMADGDMLKLFTVSAHHERINVLFITQQIFPKGRNARAISLNCQIIILFKNSRDKLQIQTLARQIYPKRTSFLIDAYEKAVAQPFSYLLIDLHNLSDARYQLRTSIFPGQDNSIFVEK